ncbi:MAG: VanZ family protein [Pseudobutyrivibrio sp.]|mgnify:FL=1|nr:VanZ family protein [Pseudobutyrivibrio sp.]
MIYFSVLEDFLSAHHQIVWISCFIVVFVALFVKRSTCKVLWFLYIAFILYMTLFTRETNLHRKSNLELFWSYRRFFDSNFYRREVTNNILLFIPFGVMILRLLSRPKPEQKFGIKETASVSYQVILSIGAGFALSCGVELIQYVFKLGLCEFDDVFGNTLGTLIGVLIVLIVKRLTGTKNSEEFYGGKLSNDNG